MRLLRRICSFVLVASLAACSGAPMRALPPAANVASSAADRTLEVIHVIIPGRAADRGSHFLSPSTKSIKFALRGPVNVDETMRLTAHSPGCAAHANGTVCTIRVPLLPCPSKKRCYSGSAATYDKVSCKKGACTVPAGAHELSADRLLDFRVRRGKNNRIVLSLSGIPKTVGIVPDASSTLSGTSASGLRISKCVTAVQDVSVIGFDADGNQIVGEGAPVAPTLTSDDLVHLAVASPGPSMLPNEFTLHPPSTLVAGPTIPNAGSVVHLTAGVTPATGAPSTKPVRSHVNVTFDSTICGKISEFPLASPTSGPSGITTGPDGAMWFAECYGPGIGRIPTNATPGSSAQIHEYSIPDPGSGPGGIVTGPDRALWFGDYRDHYIGRITTSGTVNTYSSGITPGATPWNLAVGTDRAIWFTDFNNSSIGRITTGAAPTIAEYPTNVPSGGPEGIVAASDGNLWFTEYNVDQVARITTGHTVNEYGLGITGGARPTLIAQGSDGALWFTEYGINKIGRITTAGSTAIEYPVPTASSGVNGIAAGPDRALWFTEFTAGKLGRMTTAGVVTAEYSVPTASSDPNYITTGPDGALWFTEYNSGKIGRLQ